MVIIGNIYLTVVKVTCYKVAKKFMLRSGIKLYLFMSQNERSIINHQVKVRLQSINLSNG